jgi:glycine dehydrogenase subunit 2
MKHNPRLNEKMARLPGFADIHPLQPQSTVQGALELIDKLAHWLKTLTGMPAVAMSPKAGAHGELCGCWPSAPRIEARGDAQAACWCRNRPTAPIRPPPPLPASPSSPIPRPPTAGSMLAALKAKLGPDVAAIMLTNPNTCGLFERDIVEIARLVHEAGAYFYCDGANFNAIVGRCGRAISASTPCTSTCTRPSPPRMAAAARAPARWCCRARWRPSRPCPGGRDGDGCGCRARARRAAGQAFGRMCAFHGQMGMFVRALPTC